MKAYLALVSTNVPLTPAQVQASEAGLRAYEKLILFSVGTARAPHRAIATEPESPAHRAAQAQYALALEEFQRVVVSPTAAADVPASPPAPPRDASSRAGQAGTVVMLATILALLCWLGGFIDLVAFLRQRGRLDDALHAQALQRATAARAQAELRLSVLAAQVEPHFLFNTLAGVRAAIVSDQARAAAIIDHLVDYLRATIPQMRHDAISSTVALATQLDAVRAYLALMGERMPRLSFTVDIQADLGAALVPPLMLISLVENAVKHGVEPKPGPGRIAVVARSVQTDAAVMLEVQVSDDGIGFGNATSGAGIGLANIHERLASLYGSQASLVLRTLPENGVAAILQLPLQFSPTE